MLQRKSIAAACVLSLAFSSIASVAMAGGSLFRNNAVGGISINADGVLSQPTVEATQGLRNVVEQGLKPIDGKLAQGAKLRKISLKQIDAALKAAVQNNLGEIPDELRYLAGIQRIQYVFVYPEQNDIVLAGPGEGWTVNHDGDVVGETTGKPVLLLDDLLIAMRTVDAARRVGISCSIDPTEEGIQALRRYTAKQRQFHPGVLPGMEQALGAQQISLSGIPADSHFARVLVAADYHMKRIAMHLDKSPVEGLPSFLNMQAQSRGKLTNMMPRWWMACDYQPLSKTDDGLAWELRGPGVQVMTEDSFIAQDGSFKQSGKQNPVAKKWATLMSKHYGELSEERAVFGQLRNVMDLCVVAALIEKNGLQEKANCNLPLITQSDSDFMTETWNAPKHIATQCSFIKKGKNYIITASGGVQIESWKVAETTEVNPAIAHERKSATAQEGSTWWWN